MWITKLDRILATTPARNHKLPLHRPLFKYMSIDLVGYLYYEDCYLSPKRNTNKDLQHLTDNGCLMLVPRESYEFPA